MTGPNTRATPWVPTLCTKNREKRMAHVMGTTRGDSALVATPRPSTAESTEMAGVMTPSP